MRVLQASGQWMVFLILAGAIGIVGVILATTFTPGNAALPTPAPVVIVPGNGDTAPSLELPTDNGGIPQGDGIPPSPLPPPTFTPQAQQNQVHVVQAGDTLYDIALAYGVDMQGIINANPNLDPNQIQLGQQIKIPPPVGQTP